jgi:bifunctional non-homologous end joining protein LigD
LMIKKHDDHVVEGYDAGEIDESVLSGKSMDEIAGDKRAREWKSSRPASRGKLKAAWLADAVAKLDQKKKLQKRSETKKTVEPAEKTKEIRTIEDTEEHRGFTTKVPTSEKSGRKRGTPNAEENCAGSPVKRPMPTAIHPMLAESIEEPFDGKDWLFEIKWDGYRAVTFIENGKARLVSRNQNDLTPRYPELKDLPKFVKAKNAILDGEVVALDAEGRSSFSLMQQRTGFRSGTKRATPNPEVPVLYYAFDLIYLDGYDWRRVPLEERKRKLASIATTGDSLRYSDHYAEQGKALFDIAKEKGLEGILAKRRASCYAERRSHDWLKIKIRHEIECVIGGYTEPEGTRAHFGSLVLGLYDDKQQLIHVGQVGSGFDHKGLASISSELKKRETKKNPFHGEVEALRKTYWVKPELVAQIEYTEWTHGTSDGTGPKLRAPVFLGLRDDKDPKECTLEQVPGLSADALQLPK